MNKKILIVIFACLIFAFCERNKTTEDPQHDNICGQEPCYEGPFEPPWISAYHYGLVYMSLDDDGIWTHDNRVLEGDHFLVFSDASSDEAKIRMKDTAEAGLVLIMDIFQITNRDLGIVDLESKFRIFSAYRDNKGGSRAGPREFVTFAYDSPTYLGNEIIREAQTDSIEHETTHVVQYQMAGSYSLVHDWFTEGLAEYISGGVFQPITCWPEVDEWRQDSSHVNPISVERVSRMSQGVRNAHYPLFGLAVRYLLDPKGHKKTIEDVKNMFADIKNHVDFVEAFEIHMGMSRDYFETHFYDLMEAYLPAACEQETRIRWQEFRGRTFESPVSEKSDLIGENF